MQKNEKQVIAVLAAAIAVVAVILIAMLVTSRDTTDNESASTSLKNAVQEETNNKKNNEGKDVGDGNVADSTDDNTTEAQTTTEASDSDTKSASEIMDADDGFGMTEGYDSAENTQDTGNTVPEEAADTAVADRKLIKTVNMDVETREYDKLLSAVENKVTELGGYIESLDAYNGSTYYSYRSTRNANLTIRIPKDRLEEFQNTVSELGNVTSRSENVQDVTLTYVDLQSHRDALRTEQERLLQLLEQAESVEDIITIEQRLSDVRYQLESMESQLRSYDNRVDYSTVYLYIDEVEVYTPVEEETVWERISTGFVDSLKNIGEGLKEAAIWFVIHIPYLVIWAIVIAIIILILKKIKKRTKRIRAEEQKKFAEAEAKMQKTLQSTEVTENKKEQEK